jgi:hypothetical protein
MHREDASYAVRMRTNARLACADRLARKSPTSDAFSLRRGTIKQVIEMQEYKAQQEVNGLFNAYVLASRVDATTSLCER